MKFFFGGRRSFSPTAKLQNCTCCIIKPHAIIAGQAGEIIQDLLDAGFQISAIELFKLERENSSEFLEVYKGVVNEYPVSSSALNVLVYHSLRVKIECIVNRIWLQN